MCTHVVREGMCGVYVAHELAAEQHRPVLSPVLCDTPLDFGTCDGFRIVSHMEEKPAQIAAKTTHGSDA